MKYGALILGLIGLFGCQSDQPDLSWGKSATIETNEVFNSETQLTLPNPWMIKYEATSKGADGSKRIYYDDELVMWYETYISIKQDNRGFRTLKSDSILKRLPIVIEHLTNDTIHILNVYELEDDEEYPYHLFSGQSNPKLSDQSLVDKLYTCLLEDLKD